MTDTSPGDLLRQAATQIRERETKPWILAVAGLLQVISWCPSVGNPTDLQAALAVARAYLGIEETP